VVAARHPEWGAQLAAQAGAAPTVVELIHRHQDRPIVSGVGRFERLLFQLQSADNER
jgi:hypothetical protein